MGARVKSTSLISRGHKLSSKYPQGGSQPSVNQVPRDLKLSFGLQGHQVHLWYTDIHAESSRSIAFCLIIDKTISIYHLKLKNS